MAPTLHIQEFLRQNGDFEGFPSSEVAFDLLEVKYGITAKRDNKYPNLVLFKYNQIESPFNEPMVRECRGIILDEKNDWAVVAYPYDKFFNAEEPLAANIYWGNAAVWEKVDGSLITLYWYDGEWRVSTSGTPGADCPIGNTGKTFSELFWETFNAAGYDLTLFSPGFCYMFELAAPENRIVVKYDKPRLFFHGVRNLFTYKEESPFVWAVLLQVETPRLFPTTNLFQVIEAANQLNPIEQEGFVVVDGNYNRIKVKSLRYVALHHAKSGLSKKALADLIRSGESSEVLAYFPEFQQEYDELRTKFTDAAKMIDWSYGFVLDVLKLTGLDAKTNRKEFARLAKEAPIPDSLFARLDGCASGEEYLRRVSPNRYYKILGVTE